jgi:hypothetical protein
MFTGATCGEAMTAATSTSETSAEGIRKPEILRARSALWVLRMFPPLGFAREQGFSPRGVRKQRLIGGISQDSNKSVRLEVPPMRQFRAALLVVQNGCKRCARGGRLAV